MDPVELLVRGAIAAGLAALLLAAASRAARGLLPGVAAREHASATLVLVTWLQLALFEATQVLGLYRLEVILPLALVVAAAVRRAAPDAPSLRVELGRWRAAARAAWGDAMRERGRWIYRAAAALFALSLVRGALSPTVSWDALNYHMFFAGRWIQEGGITYADAPATWDFYQYFPGGGNVLSSWWMLPFHGDLLANLGHYPAWILGLLALHSLGRELGLGAVRARRVAVAAAFIPSFFHHLNAGYVDVAMAGLALAATDHAIRFHAGRGRGHLGIAAAAAGSCAAIKLPALCVVASIGGLTAFSTWRRRAGARAWLVAALVAASVSAPWYLRNWWHAGSPFHPVPLKVLGVELSAGAPALLEVFLFPGPDGVPADPTLGARLARLSVLVSPDPADVGLPALPALLLAPFGVWILTRKGRGFATLACLATALPPAWMMLSSYLFGGVTGQRLESIPDSGRYLIFPVAVLGLLAAAGLEPLRTPWARRAARAGVLLALLANVAAGAPPGFPDLLLLDVETQPLALAALLALSLLAGPRAPAEAPAPEDAPPLTRRAAAATLVGLALLPLALAPARDRLRTHLHATSYEVHPFIPYPECWAVCDRPGEPLRIAFAAGFRLTVPGHSWFWAPLLGRWLQNEVVYVPVTRDGSCPSYRDLEAVRAVADRDAWLTRLRAREIDRLVVFPTGTMEATWARELPEIFEPLAQDRGRAYRIRKDALAARAGGGAP